VPLILVTEFVGTLAAYRAGQARPWRSPGPEPW
jgi:hypothetical protein